MRGSCLASVGWSLPSCAFHRFVTCPDRIQSCPTDLRAPLISGFLVRHRHIGFGVQVHQIIAQGGKPELRWRRSLRAGQPQAIGRSCGLWSVPWDDHISRRHVVIEADTRGVRVQRLDEARNPVFFQGGEAEQFVVETGQHFVIGTTTFTVTEDQVDVTEDAPQPVTEQAYSRQFLETIPFLEPSRQLEVLGQLPSIISGASTDEELFTKLINILFTAIPGANFMAVVAVPSPTETDIEVLHWDSRESDFAPTASERLIRESVSQDRSVVHLWQGRESSVDGSFTQDEQVDWAFCTPVSGEACSGWAIYVAGGRDMGTRRERRVKDPSELQEDLKFAELVATMLGRLRELRQLERQKATLSQFISPTVLDVFAGQDPELVLAPREAEVSVLFCDLRGFSLQSEQSSDDLIGLLNRVSLALGVMTQKILGEGGVIGDFHGDAAMGFWGWPLAQLGSQSAACRAALQIRSEFDSASREPDRPLADFRIGIGIASGKAVAGKIGTVDQVKVTVFGPVVNLAARLQDMTKALRAPILLDDQTADFLRQNTPREIARLRRVARVRPYGMDRTLEVSELLPPLSSYPELTDENIAYYEAALDALLEGDWDRAFALLHHVPAEDRVKDFLTIFIAQNNRTPPKDWDGVIPLASKK